MYLYTFVSYGNMDQKGLDRYFENFLETKSIFRSKKPFQSNFKPANVNHRDAQAETLAKVLAPCLKGDKPSNLFVFGKTGTGKTLLVRYITEKIQHMIALKNLSINLKVVYLNCKLKKTADTEYRLIAQIAREFGKAIPATGLPTEEVYNKFYSALDSENQIIILILDEIDQLVARVGDGILYNLTRMNSELANAQLGIIGISNDLTFAEHLDPRVVSSLAREEIIFPPYNALQLQDILRQRSSEAFEENVMEKGTIEKCAAYAAREHGDARRALELLRVAGEIAERTECTKLRIEHIDQAEEKIEKDRLLEAVKTQPKQSQVVLYSILKLCKKQRAEIYTGEVYEIYKTLSPQCGLVPLTQRRISSIISELDMVGIINASVKMNGRYGRTREISVLPQISENPQVQNILRESLMI